MEYLDQLLLKAINGDLVAPWLHPVMRFLSGELIWIIPPLLILGWSAVKKRWQIWGIMTAIVLTVAVTDMISAYLLKPGFGRLRPCQNLAWVAIRDGCAGVYGFPSNHSANAMAVAAFCWFFGVRRWLATTLILLAIAVGYSRIYLGAHYPFDVLAGFTLGACMAYLGARLVKKYLPKLVLTSRRGRSADSVQHDP